jgi:hypothetical protein
MRTLTDKDLQIRDQIVDLLLPLYPNIKLALEEHHLDSIYGRIQRLIAELYEEDKRLEKIFHEKSYSNLSDNDDDEILSDKLLNYLSNM